MKSAKLPNANSSITINFFALPRIAKIKWGLTFYVPSSM